MLIPTVWKISPGEKAFFWGECKKGKFIALGWSALGDLSNILDIDELKNKYLKHWNDPYSAGQCCPQIWNFFNEIQVGDVVLAIKGNVKSWELEE